MSNFVDCSNHQASIDLSRIESDGFIFKATEGRGWRDKSLPGFVAQARKLGKPIGFYHYVSQGNTPQQEARNFLDYTAPHRRPGDIMVNDWEPIGSNPGPSNTRWARELNDAIRAGAPDNPLWIYMNLSTANGNQWGDTARDVPLWLAHFPGNNRANGYNPAGPRGNVSAQWRNVIAWQFTDGGRLPGYNGDLDLNIGYGWPGTGSVAPPVVRVPEIPAIREADPPAHLFHHHGGQLFTSRGAPRLGCVCMKLTFPLIEREMIRRGLIRHQIDVFQAGYSKGVAASAGTHDMGGVIDVAQGITLEQRRVWAEFGVMMFPRTREFGWTTGDHGHGVWHGCVHRTASAAKQVRDGMNGLDGLVSNRRRNFEAPTRTWQDAYRQHAAQTITISQEDDVPDIIQTRTSYQHPGGTWLRVKDGDKFVDTCPAGKFAASAQIHGPGGVEKMRTRYCAFVGGDFGGDGWWRGMETPHTGNQAAISQAGKVPAPVQLDIWIDRPGEVTVEQQCTHWPG